MSTAPANSWQQRSHAQKKKASHPPLLRWCPSGLEIVLCFHNTVLPKSKQTNKKPPQLRKSASMFPWVRHGMEVSQSIPPPCLNRNFSFERLSHSTFERRCERPAPCVEAEEGIAEGGGLWRDAGKEEEGVEVGVWSVTLRSLSLSLSGEARGASWTCALVQAGHGVHMSAGGPQGRVAAHSLGEALVVTVQAQVLHSHQLTCQGEGEGGMVIKN